MDCYDLVYWSLCLVAFYLIVDKVISLLRIDRATDVYVLITGCDTGFGNEAAKRFDRFGCHVFAGCLTEKGKEELKRDCTDNLHAISLDVTKPESIREAYEYVKANLPKGRGLWGVINNAGVFGKMGPLEWFSIADYRDVFDVNLYGVINVTMTFLPLVKKARGRIINTSSMAGRYSSEGLGPYCVSKYGVEAFTDGLRRSLRPFEVKVILIEPGGHRTHLTSRANFINLYTAAWKGATPEAKKEYGEAFLQKAIDSFSQLVDTLCSDRITDVVDAYEKGLLGRFPRARYLVGKDCYPFISLQALPEYLGDRILTILRKPPKPAALQ